MRWSVVVRVSCLVAAVTGHDDVTVLESNSGVLAGTEVGITVVAGEPSELTGKSNAVALGEATGPADVLPCTLLVARLRRLTGQFV
jgi:hypothetical protein